jgi:hypothetical protein
LRLSVGLGYEWYANNHQLNSNRPLVSPDSELLFNVFAGDFRIKLRDKFSYQETLFVNSVGGDTSRFFNFNNVGKFARLDNLAGVAVDWDLNKVILSLAYDHENFSSTTEGFKYLNRASEWFSTSANFLLAEKASTGLEGQFSLHDYETETVLNDHWRARVGPFLDVPLQGNITIRAGGGFDTAHYSGSAEGSEFKSYYAYGKIHQDTRLFTHSLTTARESGLGDNANNLRNTYIRYSISSPVIKHIEVGANVSINFAEEFGGAFKEDFTYYRAGLRVGYQFHKYFRTDLAYEFFLKDSDLPLRDFTRNRVSWDLSFRF